MDRVTAGFGAEVGYLPPGFDPSRPGPLDRATALALLREADDRLEASEPETALALYGRTIGMPDRDISAAALFGVGNALYRLDRDDEALQAWQQATDLGDTPVAYRAWRQVAAARVRGGDLRGAFAAYRECERRAPREDRPEIASRLGWLSKELGNTGAAGRYFARSRGDAMQPFLTYLIIAVTSVTSLLAMNAAAGPAGGSFHQLESLLELNKPAVAAGDYYRLFTVTLVHDPGNILHLLFNMYALYFAGVIVERMYGSVLMGLFYVLCALAASVASLMFGDAPLAVGASGAIFGLFGVVFISLRAHNPMLDRQSRAIASQIGFLIVLNLVIGFSGVMNIDNFAHIGGLVAGIWLGLIIPPGRVATLSSFWQTRRGGGVGQREVVLLRVLGVAALVAVIVAGTIVGSEAWRPLPATGGPGTHPGGSAALVRGVDGGTSELRGIAIRSAG